ncbi:MAG: hypothetical protein WCO58_00755 [bacterium]
MKKALLIVVVAFGMIAPTFAQNSVPVQPQQTEQHFPTPSSYYAPAPQQPQVIVRNYSPAPTVRVTNPEVTVPVTIQQLPPVAPMQNPDGFSDHQKLFMFLLAGFVGVVCFIWGFFFSQRRSGGNTSGNQRPMIFYLYGGHGGNAESYSGVEVHDHKK